MAVKPENLKLAVKYSLFAGIATLINLGTQFATLKIYSGKFSIYIAILAGTGTGLVVKYVLDKKYIFYFITVTKKQDFQKFVLYSLMGVVTTLIFWGTELLFHFMLEGQWAKYVGGAIGLMIGYTTKYFLDKHFVFKDKTNFPSNTPH
jgi:putative flippase GtrA